MVKKATFDGNTAAAHVAYALSEVAAIFPITPASPMGELVDTWSAKDRKNIFEQKVSVQEMQSEAGASGSVHGSLSAGALTSTFTNSQGLLLMLPNMYKIAGEMLPGVFHIAARSLAAQALSIYADHSDVMAARSTGFGMLSSSNVQESQDMAAIAHLASIESGIPFLHFFDGFRTSHEIQKIDLIEYDTLKEMVNMDSVRNFKEHALRPEKPYAKVGAEGPEIYFQGRETVNKYYLEAPKIVRKYMDLFYEKTGRKYEPFEYTGAEDAEKLIVAMGSSTDTIDETVRYLNGRGEKVGAIKVKLYRPFSAEDFIDKIPGSVKKVAVLDRTKEPGSPGEPLYLDVVSALKGRDIEILGGRYGLSSKEFTPSMVKAVYDHLENGFNGFTVGINDDVTNLSIPIKEEIDTEPESVYRCQFWGYGSDGTVSANKNAIKIIGENTDKEVQAYFSYDAKKSGGTTRSYLRISDDNIRSTYKPTKLDFIALHKPSYIGKYDLLRGLKENGIFLMNTKHSKDEAFKHLTKEMQETIRAKNIKFYVIDAFSIAEKAGLGNRINTVMQVAFFKLTNIIPIDKAVGYIKEFIEKQFRLKGKEIVEKNWKCVDLALEAVEKARTDTGEESAPVKEMVPEDADKFAKDIVKPSMLFEGDSIPVSKMTLDGSVPLSTTKLEKRGATKNVPEWKPDKCIQCGFCSMVCPHTAIRMKQIKKEDLRGAPEGFMTIQSKSNKELDFRVQCYPEDCVECGLCVNACPVNALEMRPVEKAREDGEDKRQEFFDKLPENVTEGTKEHTLKNTQFKQPMFEFPGACAGCGETPYIKTVTQLFGDRMIIANATGCSSIWGGMFPTIPYCQDKEGKGPAWANSLFEDNAEYGLGFRLAVNQMRGQLKMYLEKLLETGTTDDLSKAIENMLKVWDKTDDEARNAAAEVKKNLPEALECVYGESEPVLKKIDEMKDYLMNKSIWAVGGDGWAYDIGYGGLDHVLAQGKNINVLVLDTEVYSNTGGQASKATPLGASAKFASAGKETPKKNMGLMMMSYGNVYIASVAMGANKQQLLKALVEAENYDGPSIIIAYAPCIAHGCDMGHSIDEEKEAVESGYWPLYRYNPDLEKEGKDPLVWESPEPKKSFKDFLMKERRYKSLTIKAPERAKKLFDKAEKDAKRRLEDIKNES
ncbi:MAG: pyruvate:ferredoxin (flavodoxin) oxidoreductase [Nanobdellota archaeon]